MNIHVFGTTQDRNSRSNSRPFAFITAIAMLAALLLLLCPAVSGLAQTPKTAAPSGERPGASANAGAHQITAVAFSPDGTKVAAGGYQVVTLFNASNGTEMGR